MHYYFSSVVKLLITSCNYVVNQKNYEFLHLLIMSTNNEYVSEKGSHFLKKILNDYSKSKENKKKCIAF